jgi:site-specific recombinase XerC
MKEKTMNQSLADRVLPKRLVNEVERLLSANNHLRANPDRGALASRGTQLDRRQILFLALAHLWEMGYRLSSVRALGERHIKLLVERWEGEGLAAGTLHNRITHLATLSSWIGKAGMTKRPVDYCPKERVARSHIAQEDKSLEAKGIDPLDVIERAKAVDGYFALYLALQHHLGFRVKESIEFRPAISISKDGKTIEVFEGTKGGRRRTVSIDSEEKRQVVKWALEVANRTRTGRVRWPDRTFRQARRRVYHLAETKLGLTRSQLGSTMHGMRHGFVHRTYKDITGLPVPIKGGALGKIDWQTHHWALLQVSKEVGHSRVEIVGAYASTYGHALRGSKVTQMTYNGMPINLNPPKVASTSGDVINPLQPGQP